MYLSISMGVDCASQHIPVCLQCLFLYRSFQPNQTKEWRALQVLMNPRDAQGQEITWRNVAALDGYVRRLNEVADRLADKNRWVLHW